MDEKINIYIFSVQAYTEMIAFASPWKYLDNISDKAGFLLHYIILAVDIFS